MRSEDARSKSELEASAADPAVESTGDEARAQAPAAVAHSDGDDLASLGSGLASLRPGPDEATDGVEDESNLGALAAAGAARIKSAEHAESDDTTLDLGRLVAAATRTVERSPSIGTESAGTVSGPSVADAVSGPSAHAVTAASLVPSRRRATWLVPMLVGVGLGAVIAGASFGLAGSRTPAPASALDARNAAPAPHKVSEVEPAPPDPANAPAPSATSAAETAAIAPAHEAVDSALHAAARPLVAPHPVPPRRPASADPSTPAPPVTPATPDDHASLLKPKLPVAPQAPASLEELAAAAAPETKADPAEANAKTPSRVDQMLDEALAPEAQRAAARQQHALALAADQLPATPSRDDVTKSMTVLLPAIRGCAMGQTGLMTAGIVVRNDGRVASVDVSGAPFANTPSGRCMEGVMRRAQFPRFRQPIFRIKFPFAIQ